MLCPYFAKVPTMLLTSSDFFATEPSAPIFASEQSYHSITLIVNQL